MKDLKLSFASFELLSEDAEGKLTSGFSEAFEGDALSAMGANNCYGGNCAANCGGSGGESGSGCGCR